MRQIKSVNVFTQGDSTKPSTWSNVPYSFSNALEKCGIKVNRIDIIPENNLLFRKYAILWDKVIKKIISRIFKDQTYSIDRSYPFRILVNKKIKNAVRFYNDADYNIFLTYSYKNKFSSIPSLLMCDYTFEYFIEEKLRRIPNLIEKSYINYEKKIITESEIVICLFSTVAAYMTSKYSNKINYLGRIGLNIVSQEQLIESHVITKKETSDYILFIGSWNQSYNDAAKLLIDTFILLKGSYPDLKLYIIGMGENAFSKIPSGVTCFGYLDKENEDQRKIYYDLLLNAKMFINTSGSYCATVEAMYYYTPVITSKYEEFIHEFGNELSFGLYCDKENKNLLLLKIKEILESSEYTSMCISAHETVVPNTWQEFSKRIIHIMSEN